MIIGGIPQYVFVDGAEPFNQMTTPLSHLYQPVIVNRNRNIQAEGTITVKIKTAYTSDTEGISHDTTFPERELYPSKVPLSSHGFEYPIKFIKIELIEEGGSGFGGQRGGEASNIFSVRNIILTPRSPGFKDFFYVELGNIYFRDSIDTMLVSDSSEFNNMINSGELSADTKKYYRLTIKFDMIVPDSGSEEHNRLALTQATSYGIMEYMNQYTFAKQTADMISEIAYTETMTLISTAISAAAIYFGSWAVAGLKEIIKEGSKKVINEIMKLSLKEILKFAGMAFAKFAFVVGIGSIKEMFEEIIVDGFLETWGERIIQQLGGSEDQAFWFTTLLTSGREGLSGIRGTIMKGLGKTKTGGRIRNWVAKQFATDSNSQVSKDNKKAEKFNEEFGNKDENPMLKQDKVSSWRKIVGSGLLKLLLSIIPAVFTGGLLLTNFLATLGIVSTIEGFAGDILGRYQTLKINEKKQGRNENFKKLHSLMKNIKESSVLPKSKIEGVKHELEHGYLEKYGESITPVNNFPQSNDPMSTSSSLETKIGVGMAATSQGIAYIDYGISGEYALKTQKTSRFDMQAKEDNFRVAQGIQARLTTLRAKELQTINADVRVVKIRVDDLSSSDKAVFDQLTAEINDISIWNGISNTFTLPNDPSLTIDKALSYIKIKLGINPKATLFFASETYRTLDYISHKDKKTFTQRKIEIDGTEFIIGPETKFSVIENIGDLEVRFTLENQLNNIDGYSEARKLLSFLVGGKFNFERLASTDEEALIMSKLIKGGDKWGGLESYADRFLQETGLYSKASTSYKAALEAGLFAHTFRMFADKSLIDQIVAACETDRQANEALKNYKKLIAAVFSTQFKSLLDTTTHTQALEYMRENAKILMANYILEKIGADKDLSIYDAAQKFEEFMENPQQIQNFESEFSQKFFKSKDGILKQLSKGFFDTDNLPFPHITKSVQMLIGRTQESNDFFGDFRNRLVSEFIDSKFKMPKAFKGINYGGKGSILDINKFITEDVFTDIEKSLLGVSEGWSQEFQRLSQQTPSDRRFFDNLLMSFAGAYLSSPNKGSFGKLGWKAKAGLVNDLISTSFSAMFTELASVLKLEDIKDFKATIAIGADGATNILDWIVKKLFTERESLKDFTVSGNPEELKTPSKYSFLFSITNWVNSEAKLSDYSTKSEAIFAVREFFYTFKDKHHKNYRQLKTQVKSLASKFYKHDYVKSMGVTFSRAVDRLFTNNDFLNDMIQPIIGGGYQILWEDHFNIMIEVLGGDGEPVKLSRSYIPESYNGEPVHILRGNEWVQIATLESGFSFDSAYVYVYRVTENDKIQLGLAKVEDIKNDFSDLPFQLHEGFPTTDGRVLHDIWMSNSEGNLLLSDVDLYDFSIRSDENKEWYKDYFSNSGQPLRNLFVGYIFNSGQKMAAYLQKIELNVQISSPVTHFFPDLPAQNIKSLKEYQSKFSPLLGTDKTDAFGTDFTIVTVNKIVYDLFDPTRSWKNRMFQQQILKYLPQLNGYFKGGLKGKFTQGSNLETINNFVEKLTFSDDELQRFGWKEIDGTFRYSQSLKEWLDLIYTKITSYYLEGGLDVAINNEAKKLLRMADSAYPSHTPLSLVTNRKLFSDSEFKMGNEIFKTASNLFGHFTVRLMLSDMVNFNPDKTIFFLSRPTNLKDLVAIHDHVGFVATRQHGDATVKKYSLRGLQHTMGAFFLDSHVYLPLTSGTPNSRINSYVFNFGPILFNDANLIQAKTQKSLSWKIATKLANQYQSLNTLKSLFYKSQDNLFKTIEKLITEKIIDADYTNDKDKNIWLARRLINQARKEIFSLYMSTGDLRQQIKSQLSDSSSNLIKLSFKGIPTSSSIVLEFSKDRLIDSDFMTWGVIDERYKIWQGMIDYKNMLIDENVRNMVQLLTTLISEHGSGKVIILPAVNTDDQRLGYRHYFGYVAKGTTWLPSNSEGKSYFEIDLSDTPRALAQLIHISYSMQAYDAAFVITEWVDIEKDYGGIEYYLEQNEDMIAAFDYRGFLRKDEIYVGDENYFGDPIIRPRNPIKISDYSTNLYDDQEVFDSYVRRWDSCFVSHVGMSTGSKNSDFVKYMARIKERSSEFERIMYEILFGNPTNT